VGLTLTPAQRDFARESAMRQGASSLLAALGRNALTDEERIALGTVITTELAYRGFDAEYNLTDAGRELEKLIDVLNASD
jgi:hypothetical protein